MNNIEKKTSRGKKVLMVLLSMVMMVSISATELDANFTPSVTAKQAPELVEITNAAGETVAAIIYDSTGAEEASVPVGRLFITPFSEAQGAVPVVKDALIDAYNQLNTTALDVISPELKVAMKNYSADMVVNDIVVRDLFVVSLDEVAEQQLAKSGNSIKFTLSLDISSDALFFVLQNTHGTTWELIFDDKAVINEDRSVTLQFEKLSPIAFLVDGGQLVIDPNAPDSPLTGYDEFPTVRGVAIGIGLLVMVALILVILKQRH